MNSQVVKFERYFLWTAVNKRKEVLILDEPTTGLDFESQQYLIEFVHTNPEKQLIIVMTHDKDLKDAVNDILNLE